MSRRDRIPTDGGQPLSNNPFAGLSAEGLPDTPVQPPAEPAPTARRKKKSDRGRVDIIRQTAHRGGRTVIVVTGFTGIGLPEKEQLARAMQRACGVGGTVKDGNIEIQGENREKVAQILKDAGFRPVFAGG